MCSVLTSKIVSLPLYFFSTILEHRKKHPSPQIYDFDMHVCVCVCLCLCMSGSINVVNCISSYFGCLLAIWFQDSKLYHFSMFHASHHIFSVPATEDEVSLIFLPIHMNLNFVKILVSEILIDVIRLKQKQLLLNQLLMSFAIWRLYWIEFF